jgi:hypothetical protein
MALWLHGHLAQVRQHEAAGDIHREVAQAVDRGWQAVNRPAPRVYGGPCPHCRTDLLSKPGRTLAACNACGASYGIAERQEWMRGQLEDMLGTVTWCLSAARGIGRPVSEHTVRSWIHRHKLQPTHYQSSRKPDGKPEPLYRFGEILKLADENPPRPRMGHDEEVPADAANVPGTRPI